MTTVWFAIMFVMIFEMIARLVAKFCKVAVSTISHIFRRNISMAYQLLEALRRQWRRSKTEKTGSRLEVNEEDNFSMICGMSSTEKTGSKWEDFEEDDFSIICSMSSTDNCWWHTCHKFLDELLVLPFVKSANLLKSLNYFTIKLFKVGI